MQDSSSFHRINCNTSSNFKNRELFLQNIELKKIDSQSRLLLRQISHGVLLTSYIAKVNIDDDRLHVIFGATKA
jgi:hypothetical protein